MEVETETMPRRNVEEGLRSDPKTRQKTYTEYYEACLVCGIEIAAPTEKRLRYLMATHKWQAHKGPRPKEGVNY